MGVCNYTSDWEGNFQFTMNQYKEEEYKEALLAVIDGIYGMNVDQLCNNLGVDDE